MDESASIEAREAAIEANRLSPDLIPAAALAEQIRPGVEAAGWWLIGPAPAPVARVAGRSRWQLLLHGPAGSPLPLPPEAELRQALPAQVGLAIDPDPLML